MTSRRPGAVGALCAAAVAAVLLVLPRGPGPTPSPPPPAAEGATGAAGAPASAPALAARPGPAVPIWRAAPSRWAEPAPADLAAIVEQVHFSWRPAGGGWRGDHDTYSAVRRDDGILEVTPRHHDARAGVVTGSPVAFAPARIGRGRARLADDAGRARADARGRLEIARGDVVEELRNGPGGVEQSWRVEGPPPGSGDLEVRIPLVAGRLVAETAAGLHFTDGALGVRYGHARWIDAAGEETAIPSRWDGSAIALRVPETVLARSTWPAVLDPAIGPELTIDAPVDRSPDFIGQYTPAVAAAGSDYLVVWSDSQYGAPTHVYGARVRGSDGVVLDATAICTVAASQTSPAVASDGTDYLVVWEDSRNGGLDLYGAIVRGSSGKIATAQGGFPICTAVGYQTAPSVAWDGTSYLVVWQDLRAIEQGAPSVDADVYGARIGAGGAALDGDGFLVAGGAGYQGVPVVAWNGAYHLVVFQDESSASGIPEVRAQRVDPAGAPYGAPLVIAAYAGASTSPAIAPGAGAWLVAWDLAASPRGVFGSRVWYSGFTAYVSGSIMHALGAGTPAVHPAVGWNGHHVLAAWRDPATADLVGVRLSDQGAVADADPFVIATSVRNVPRDLTITRLGTDFLVGYTKLDPDPAVLGYRAHVRRIAGNRAPVASDVTLTIPEDTTRLITAAELGSDPDGDALTMQYIGDGIAPGAGPSMTYTPALDFHGTQRFRYVVSDGLEASGIATVTLVVTPVNDAPEAQGQTVATAEDTPLPITLAATDVDGDPLTYAIRSGPAHGGLSGTPPALVYTPTGDYTGPDAFTFTASDGHLESAPATVSLTVTPVNDAPVAHAGAHRTVAGTSVTIGLVATDVDGPSLTYAIVTRPVHGTLTGAGATYTYTPGEGFTGSDSLVFKVSDGSLESAPATVTITVADPRADTTAAGSVSAFGCSSGGGAAGLLPVALVALALARLRRRRAVLAAVLAAALAAAPAARAAAPTSPPAAPATARAASRYDVPLPPPPVLRPAPRPAAAPRKPARVRVAVMPIRAGLGVDAAMASLVTDALVAELTDRGLVTITSKDVQAALGFEREKQLLGCSDDGCLAQIAGALGADRVVFGDLAQVQGLTIFSAQVFDTRAGAVERRFHERMSGGEAEDLLDATGRAAAELFPGTPRTGTASRRRSILTASSAHPLALVLRGGADVRQPGGFGALMLEYRPGRALRVGAGALGAGTRAAGAALRLAWAPLALDHLSIYAAVEAQLLFPKDVVAGGAMALGLEWAFTRRFALAAEAPYVFLASAPARFKTTYFMPGLALAWRF